MNYPPISSEALSNWITATLTQRDDGVIIVSAPSPYPCIGGEPEPPLIIVTVNDDGDTCPARDGIYACPLYVNHVGPHWRATQELWDEVHPVGLAAVLESA